MATETVDPEREFADVYGTETIEGVVRTSYDQFTDTGRINRFPPLNTERFARQRLYALANVDGHIAGVWPSRQRLVDAQPHGLHLPVSA